MGYKFTRGGPGDFRIRAEAEKRRIVAESIDIMREVTDDAVDRQKHIIDTAETDWGRLRQSQGRESAGRRESDSLYDAITSKIDPGRGEVTGYFGWLYDFKKYYEYQDNGTSRIEAANSLAQAFVEAEQELEAKVKSRLITRRLI